MRNSSGGVVQFLYGEDGMDGVRVEEQVWTGDARHLLRLGRAFKGAQRLRDARRRWRPAARLRAPLTNGIRADGPARALSSNDCTLRLHS